MDKMYQFGLALGVAFQIGDNILDMSGDTQSTGKPVFKDIENNAGNIVLLHALSKGDAIQKNAINSLLFKKWFTSLEAEKVVHLLGSSAPSSMRPPCSECRPRAAGPSWVSPPSHARNALGELSARRSQEGVGTPCRSI